jgi:hypothetical protein
MYSMLPPIYLLYAQKVYIQKYHSSAHSSTFSSVVWSVHFEMETNFITWAMARGAFLYLRPYSQRAITAYASELWERVNDTFKLQWKTAAKQFNEQDGRTGRRKFTAFWYFAKALEGLIKTFSAEPFLYNVWMHLTPEARIQFYIPVPGVDLIDLY